MDFDFERLRKDKDVVLSQHKRLDVLQLELQSFTPMVEKVGKLAENLFERGHLRVREPAAKTRRFNRISPVIKPALKKSFKRDAMR